MRACERYIISKEMEIMGSFENGSFTWLRFAGSDIPKRKKEDLPRFAICGWEVSHYQSVERRDDDNQ
jgi:hypothetical protein